MSFIMFMRHIYSLEAVNTKSKAQASSLTHVNLNIVYHLSVSQILHLQYGMRVTVLTCIIIIKI